MYLFDTPLLKFVHDIAERADDYESVSARSHRSLQLQMGQRQGCAFVSTQDTAATALVTALIVN